ncbi:hypothetical protein WICMUC_005217 [Wickerhamomyces mucosus]|uniref:Mitochondrial import inner membrane translocase subunit TIM44 n=1 Tax=Wickerhamomyces mucosus TaxID=1378264 RepID=A0A9P8P9D6_9ASCO|nr:hypothetical protein WICMUC_005217 [Wickerhamomyces mucosus]
MLVRKAIKQSSKALVARRALHATFQPKNQPPKSPLGVFVDTFRKEWKKSQDLQDGIKALQDETGKIGESDAYKKAKEAYQKAQKSTTVLGKTIKDTGEVIEKVAIDVWDSEAGKYTRKVVERTATSVDKVIEPVRQTRIYKDVSEVLDDSSISKYGGFEEKEQRKLRREKELASGKRPKAVKSNEEAGNALVATDIAPEGESVSKKMEDFQTNTTVGRQLTDFKTKYWDESENPLIGGIRTVFEKVGGLFAETEHAQVIRLFKQIDPGFNSEDFTKQLREYIVPEILDAYVKGDEKTLKIWFSEAPYNVYAAQQKAIREKEVFSDSSIRDIRNVEIVNAKLLPSNIPVLVVGCRASELLLYRKAKTNEIAEGDPSSVFQSSYAMVLTRFAEEVDNKETEGWKVLEFVRGGSRPQH